MAWPSLTETGVQLGYGAEGGIVYQSNSEADKLILTKVRKPAIELHEISLNSQVLIEPQLPGSMETALGTESENEEFDDVLATNYVPNGMTKGLKDEADNFQGHHIYDPTIKQLVAQGKVKIRGDEFFKVIAAAGGTVGSQLSVSIIGIRNDQACLLSTLSLSLSYPIKQIVFCDLSETFGSIGSRYFLVRSDLTVYILKITSDVKGTSFNLVLIEELTLWTTIADMNFNYWDFTQFAVIDTKGNCDLWAIQHSNHDTVKRVTSVPLNIDNPGELSHFKMVRWGSHGESILLIDRSIINWYNLKTRVKKTVMIANAFSRVQDYIKVSNEHALLLTSRELFLLETTDTEIKKLLVWKHFLDSEDPSLKLAVSDFTSINFGRPAYHCCISSKYTKLILNMQFWLKDGFFRCLSSPFFFNAPTVDDVDQLIMLPYLDRDLEAIASGSSFNCIKFENTRTTDENAKILLFELSRELKLQVRMFCSEKGNAEGAALAIADLAEHLAIIDRKLEADARTHELKQIVSTEANHVKLYKSDGDPLTENSSFFELSNFSDEIKEVGFCLTNTLIEFQNSKSTEASNLWVGNEFLIEAEDIDEFDRMLKQLINHFAAEELVITVNRIAEEDYEFNQSRPLRSAYQYLEMFHSHDKDNLIQSAVQLCLSQITYSKPFSMVASSAEEEEMDFPDDIKQLLENWNGNVETGHISSNIASHLSEPAPPLLRFSQPEIRVRARASGSQKAPTEAPSSQLYSQSSQESSQPFAATQIERGVFGDRGANKKKKKKKKLGGFA